MSGVDVLGGIAALAVLLLGCGAWGVLAARASCDPAERALAALLATTAAVIAVHAAPLVLGVLSRGSVLASSGVAGVGALVAWRRAGRRSSLDGVARPERAARRGLPATLVCAAVAVAAVAAVLADLGTPPLGTDVLTFYGPQVARWMQTGSLWQLDQFVPLVSNATYPQHGDLVLLAVVLPFSSMALAPLVTLPFYAGTGVAVGALARRAGAGPGPAALVAAAVLALPIVALPGLRILQTDALMLCFVTTGALFALRGRPGLAVLGLGLALGTKWYGLTSVPIVGAALLALAWPGARRAVTAAAGVLAVGGLWLVRNAVETGNPVFPADPPGPLDAPRDVVRELGGFTLLDYAGAPSVWREYLLPGFSEALGAAGAVLVVLAVTAALLAVARRDRRRLVLAACAAGLALAYAATPYSAFGPEGRPVLAYVSVRYGVPALIAGSVLAAWALSRRGPAAMAGRLVLGVATLATLARWTDGVGVAMWTAAAVVAAAGWMAWRLPGRARIALALAVAAPGTWALARTAPSYAPYDPAFAWIERETPSDRSIGLAGVWDGIGPALPAFGPRLGNRVEYVGPFVEGLLRTYGSEGAFRAALRRGDYDALVVGRGRPPRPEAREEAWARAEGYTLQTASPTLALYAPRQRSRGVAP